MRKNYINLRPEDKQIMLQCKRAEADKMPITHAMNSQEHEDCKSAGKKLLGDQIENKRTGQYAKLLMPAARKSGFRKRQKRPSEEQSPA